MNSSVLQRAKHVVFYLLLLFLPTQFGKHFFPDFITVAGIQVDYLFPTLYVTDLLIILFLLLHTPLLKHLRLQKIRLSMQEIVLVLFSFVVIFGIFLSVNKPEAVYGLIKLIEFSLFAFCVAVTVKKNVISKIVRLFSITLFFESFLAIWQFVLQKSIGGLFYFFGERAMTVQTPGAATASLNGQLVLRPYGTFSHPNVLAGFLVIALSVIFLQRENRTNKQKLIFFMLIGIGTIALVLTLSRFALLVWIGMVAYRMILNLRSAHLQKTAIIVLAMLVIAYLLFYFTPLHFRYIENVFTDESFTQREQLTDASLRMIGSHLFFGVGINNFLPNLPFVEQTPTMILQPVHNILLLIASQIGVVGLVLVLIFSYQTYQQVRKQEKHFYKTIGFCLVAIFLLGQTDHYFLTLQQGQLLLALFIGLAYAKV